MELPSHDAIANFVRESNAIEGIFTVKTLEVSATKAFLHETDLSVGDLEQLVHVYQPDAYLRKDVGVDVRVGDHVPIGGGPEVVRQLTAIIERARDREDPHDVHCAYENLHPFTDGNGRSGRALWAWQMVRQGPPPRYALALGFLHAFYYQTLQRRDENAMRVAVLEEQVHIMREGASD